MADSISLTAAQTPGAQWLGLRQAAEHVRQLSQIIGENQSLPTAQTAPPVGSGRGLQVDVEA